MHDVFAEYDYATCNIYNMDEAGFSLSSDRKTRQVGPIMAPRKSQATMANDIHITVIATISIANGPVPPFIIYPGAHLIEEWVAVQDDEPEQMATVTTSGYVNLDVVLRWLVDCFDPRTRERAGRFRRLLFLDGHDTHVQVSFLEACWERNIVCVIIPAHMSQVYQPLDVSSLTV